MAQKTGTIVKGSRMNLQEIAQLFDMSLDKLRFYESEGLLRRRTDLVNSDEYMPGDIERLGAVDILLKIGFTIVEIKKYFELTECKGTNEKQIRMLRKQRKKLLDDVHGKQQLLDKVDYLIWKTNKEAKARKIINKQGE